MYLDYRLIDTCWCACNKQLLHCWNDIKKSQVMDIHITAISINFHAIFQENAANKSVLESTVQINQVKTFDRFNQKSVLWQIWHLILTQQRENAWFLKYYQRKFWYTVILSDSDLSVIFYWGTAVFYWGSSANNASKIGRN